MNGRPAPLRRALAGAAVLSALALPAPHAAADATRGVFGVTVAVTGEGLLRPVVRSARIVAVQPGLPAAAAGVGAGDEVLEVDGQRVAGATAEELAPLARGKRIGETVQLLLRRAGGAPYRVSLVAVAPSKPD